MLFLETKLPKFVCADYAGNLDRLTDFTNMAYHKSVHHKITKHAGIRPSPRTSSTPHLAHVEHPQFYS